MGCSSAKSGSAYAASQPNEKAVVPDLQLRMSLGEIPDDGEGDTDANEVTDKDRSMLTQLCQQQLLDFCADEDGGGKRYSISSTTDNLGHLVSSFGSKQVKLEGAQQLDASKEGIGYACKKGHKPESPNQDSFLIMKVEGKHALYGVFDGHGRKGHDISNFVKDIIPKLLLSQPMFDTDPAMALQNAFQTMQYLLIKATAMDTIDATRSGSTCSLVLHSIKSHMLYIAHVGDSRVVLGRQVEGKSQAVDLTVDHKPDLPEERERIEKNGGVVIFDGGWNYRVFAKDKTDARGKRYPGLNMSRAMGDLNGFHDAGISAIPDVNRRITSEAKQETDSQDVYSSQASQASVTSKNSTTSIASVPVDPAKDKFLLLCSDGVWEFVSSEEAVQEVGRYPCNEASMAAEHLAAISWTRWMKQMDGQVVDDITAVIAYLSNS